MPNQKLSARALNRATLARQMLVERHEVRAPSAIEKLAGMQAQLARPPFIGLWSRLAGFSREELVRALQRRQVVRAPLMRCTLHLLTARDLRALHGAIQPALDRAMESVLRTRLRGLDIDAVMQRASDFFEAPHTFDDLRRELARWRPKGDIRAMAYAVRCKLPLVQVTDDSAWGFPASADFVRADRWLGESIPEDDDAEALVLRYLAAFGPASVRDAVVWSGVTSLAGSFEALRKRLVTFEDERGRELFDLPKAPRPSEEVEAPVRFLPEFDNLVLGHDDRTRFISKEHRANVFLPGLRVAPTFLVDGRVAGTWKIERKKTVAVLLLSPFGGMDRERREALQSEGEGLVRFVEPDTEGHEVRFSKGR